MVHQGSPAENVTGGTVSSFPVFHQGTAGTLAYVVVNGTVTVSME